jgi:hypothetical protein
MADSSSGILRDDLLDAQIELEYAKARESIARAALIKAQADRERTHALREALTLMEDLSAWMEGKGAP